MTEAEYYAAISKLGLRPTKVPQVFVTGYGEVHSVPHPGEFTPDQLVEVLDRIKRTMGISWRDQN